MIYYFWNSNFKKRWIDEVSQPESRRYDESKKKRVWKEIWSHHHSYFWKTM